MSTTWMPCKCPECGHEDQMDVVDHMRGWALVCEQCDHTMLPMPGYEYDEDEEEE